MLIPAKNAQVHWSENPNTHGEITRVVVFDRTQPWEDDESLECSAGACCSDWLDGSDPRSTPEGIYAGWLRGRFYDEAAHIEALEQLAKIEGCAWAGVMAAAMRMGQPKAVPFMEHDDGGF